MQNVHIWRVHIMVVDVHFIHGNGHVRDIILQNDTCIHFDSSLVS